MARDGVLSVRAADTAGGVSVEGWYDSLSMRRRTGEDELVPDTDGLIGGRYRGLLGPRGAYVSSASPFVPDEVAEVAELAGAFEDLFPPLPPRPLAAGASWGDSTLQIRRLADTVVAGRAVRRFGLLSRRERRETIPYGDTVPLPDSADDQRAGRVHLGFRRAPTPDARPFWWRPRSHPTAESRRPVRSRVEQQVELVRLPGPPALRGLRHLPYVTHP